MIDNATLRRIKKLLALSRNNPSAAEAGAAAAAARDMLTAHDLSLAEIEASGGEDSRTGEPVGTHGFEECKCGEPVAADPFVERCPCPGCNALYRRGAKRSAWRGWLAEAVAKAHDCRMFWRGSQAVMIGRPTDATAARMLYQYLVAEIDRLARFGGGRRAWAHSFRLGAVRAIARRLTEPRAAPATESVALVLQRNVAEVEVAYQKEVGSARPARMSHQASDGEGYVAGHRAGRQIHLGAQIPSSAGAARLPGRK